MFSLRNLVIGSFSLALTAAVCTAANAVPCGIISISNGNASSTYDPFNPAPLTVSGGTMTITRAAANQGGGKTQGARIYAYLPPNSPAYQLSFTGSGVGTGAGTNIVHIGSHPTGLTTTGTVPAGVVELDFNGAAQPDTATVNFSITIPPAVPLNATQNVVFQLYYVCKGTGGYTDVTTPTLAPAGITFNLNVLSALRATTANTPLTFGEIGDLDLNEVQTTPHNSSTGNLNVWSSGPYSVEVSSLNDYRMVVAGGSVANANQRIPYRLNLLGQTAQTGSAFTLRNCSTATITGKSHQVNATLLGAGEGQAPGNYSDTVTVTVRPLAGTFAAASCQTTP